MLRFCSLQFQDAPTDVQPRLLPGGAAQNPGTKSSSKSASASPAATPISLPVAGIPAPPRVNVLPGSGRAGDAPFAQATPGTDIGKANGVPRFKGPSASRASFRAEGEPAIRPCPACGARCACSACRSSADGGRTRADSSDDEGVGARSAMCGCFVNKILTRLGPGAHDGEDGGAGEAKPSAEPQSRSVGIPMTFDNEPAPKIGLTKGLGSLPARETRGSSPKLFSHTKFLGLEAHSDEEDEGEEDHGRGGGAPASRAAGGTIKPTSVPPTLPAPRIVPAPSDPAPKKSMFQAMKDRLSGGGGSSVSGSSGVGADGFVKVRLLWQLSC